MGFSCTALNPDPAYAAWAAVPLGELSFPALPHPQTGDFHPDFWLSRHREYNRLRWHRLDWGVVRTALASASEQIAALGAGKAVAPELAFDVPGLGERTFVEMWFGYGEPAPVGARRLEDGRYEVGYGQHRICAWADFPMNAEDCALMRVPETGFTPGGPLPSETLVPVLVYPA